MADRRHASAQIAALSDAQIQSFGQGAMQQLLPAQIAAFTPHQFALFTPNQMQYLNPYAGTGITVAQVQLFTGDQLAAIQFPAWCRATGTACPGSSDAMLQALSPDQVGALTGRRLAGSAATSSRC